MHNWLHLGSQRVKFGSKGNTQEIARCCPYCHQDEDFIHMLTCTDPRAQKFRYDAAIPLRTVLSKSGDAGNFLLRVIQTWTKTPLDPIVLTHGDSGNDIQAAINQALESQTNIGWTHLFRGFVSLAWGLMYPTADIRRMNQHDRRCQSKKTLTKVISAVQDYTLAIWKSRNEVLHECGSDSLLIVHAALNHSISQLYALQHTFSPILQSYFTLPLETRLRQSPRQRQRWLRLARLATSHSSAQGARQQLLSTYFPYAQLQHEAPSGPALLPSDQPSVPHLLQQSSITSYYRSSSVDGV